MLGGWLSDRHGRRPVNVWGNLLFLLMIYPVFAWIVTTRSEIVLFIAMTALSAAGNFTTGSLFASLAEGLPKSIRSAAFGTVFAISIAAFGGTTQLVLTWLIHVTGSAMAPAWYLIGATTIAQVGFMLIPESAPSQRRPQSATAQVAASSLA
jgi:MFS family permease